jgi:hypothetical protein
MPMLFEENGLSRVFTARGIVMSCKIRSRLSMKVAKKRSPSSNTPLITFPHILQGREQAEKQIYIQSSEFEAISEILHVLN